MTIDQIAVELQQEHFPDDSWVETANDAFVLGSMSGNLEFIQKLLEATRDCSKEDRENMIHKNNNEAFLYAAQNGHLNIINLLIDLTQDDPQKQMDMMYASGSEEFGLDLSSETPQPIRMHNYTAFKSAVSANQIKVVERLLELTTDEHTKLLMINGYGGGTNALRSAVQNNSLEMVTCLVNALNDEDRERALIGKDSPCKLAIQSGNFQIAHFLTNLIQDARIKRNMINQLKFSLHESQQNDLIDTSYLILNSTQNKEQRQNLIDSVDDPTPRFSRFLEIISGSAPAEGDDEATKKLKKLRHKMIAGFGEEDTMGANKADQVIATLLTKDNLKVAKDYLTDMKLVYHETDKAEQSPLRKSPEDVQNKFSQLCFPIDFPTLSGKDKETALTILILISSLNEPLAESIEKIKAERVASATNTIFEFTK